VLSPDVAEGMLAAAARDGDATLFDEVLKAAKSERDPSLRPLLVRALGAFRDKALLERAFDGTFDIRESFRILMGPLGDPAVADLPYEYVKLHYDEIVPKLPTGVGTDYAAMFPLFARASACSESAREDVETFFEPRMQKVQGGPRNLANALETIHLCAAEKPAAEAAITKFLGEYGRTSATSLGNAH
jgi:alanyl aminopeptidase